MLVREATTADLPGILEIYNEAVANTAATYDDQPNTLEQRQLWFAEHQQTGFPIYVAINEAGRLIGWSSLSRFHKKPGYRFTAENSVYVAADQRGKGIGKLLLTPLLAAAERLRLRAILAVIDAENQVSIKLHEKFGFEQVGHFKQVGYKFNRWRDVVYLEKLLAKHE